MRHATAATGAQRHKWLCALRAFDAAARRVVEAHGGVVQKFVGDAVTAVFGVPALHEDDAERAVRAGLSLVEQAGALAGLAEARATCVSACTPARRSCSLDIEPASGEGFLTGDVLTVAARLQSLAPATGVVVSESTHAAHRGVLRVRGARDGRTGRRRARCSLCGSPRPRAGAQAADRCAHT